MANFMIEEILEKYKVALTGFEKAVESSFKKESQFNNIPIKFWTILLKIDSLAGILFWREYPEQFLVKKVLEVLVARDALQKQLENTETPAESLVKVSKLDRDLRKQFEAFSRKICQDKRRKILTQLEDLQNVCEPQKKAWWWFPKIYIRWWERFDLAWDTLAFLWLVATFSLLTDISSRFLSGGADLFGFSAVIFQSALALASGGTLTTTGQAVVENTLKRWKIPRHLWEEAKFIAASLLLLIFVSLRLSLPKIALVYSNFGLRDYQAGRLTSAQSNYKRALALNPNDGRTHFYLGSLYEEFQDFKSARTEYQIAIKSRFDAAYNNLARLHILDKNYNDAAYLLRLLEVNPSIKLADNKIVHYTLHKNMGWVRLEQGLQTQDKTSVDVFLAEAKANLETAIDLARENQLSQKQQASAHCLLAQVLEAQGDDSKQVQKEWEYCLDYNPVRTPEEDAWKIKAQQRLSLEKIPILPGGGL